MFLSERIQALAPANAAFFRLVANLIDGTTRVFPVEPNSYFKLGDSPYGVPSGNYTLCFFDEQCRPMPHHDQSIHVNLQNEVHRAGQAQLSLHMSGSGGAGAGAAGPNRLSPPAESKDVGINRNPIAPEAARNAEEPDLEMRRYLHAMDLEERQQDFIKNSTYITEVGELFTLNRIMRKEIMELQRVILVNAQQAYKDAEQIKSAAQGLLSLQKEVLASAREEISRPPPPPPDYVGLGHSALTVVREIGVALINRSQARGTSRELPTGKSAPQLAETSASERKDAPVVQSDVIEKMIDLIRNSTEFETAMATSSPERWKNLIDKLITDAKLEKSLSGNAQKSEIESTK